MRRLSSSSLLMVINEKLDFTFWVLFVVICFFTIDFPIACTIMTLQRYKQISNQPKKKPEKCNGATFPAHFILSCYI